MTPQSLRVLTWNIGFGSASTLDPLVALRPLPDIVTLQEVKVGEAEAISARLRDVGFECVYSGRPSAGKPEYGNVSAARSPLTAIDTDAHDFPYPQLIAHAKVETPGGLVNVITVHVPNGSGYGWTKIDTLVALKRMVRALKGEPLILTGDFNEPQWAPLQGGHVVSWGEEWDGERWSPWKEWEFDGVTGSGKRWDAAVRWFFDSKRCGLRNVFWEHAGHGSMEQTHMAGDGPRWFDHIFVSHHFGVASCAYLHAFRSDGHSDHSALEAALTRASG